MMSHEWDLHGAEQVMERSCATRRRHWQVYVCSVSTLCDAFCSLHVCLSLRVAEDCSAWCASRVCRL